jgi:hypothetical protein
MSGAGHGEERDAHGDDQEMHPVMQLISATNEQWHCDAEDDAGDEEAQDGSQQQQREAPLGDVRLEEAADIP